MNNDLDAGPAWRPSQPGLDQRVRATIRMLLFAALDCEDLGAPDVSEDIRQTAGVLARRFGVSLD